MCSVDWPLVINALAALGSISAAIAALYIATRDRKERNRERLAADEAEAKLVFAGMSINNPPSSAGQDAVRARGGDEDYDPDTHPSYPMWLVNNSQRPILDVRVIVCKMCSDPSAVAELPEAPDSSSPRSLVQPGQESRTSGVKFFTADGTRLPQALVEGSPGRPWADWPDVAALDIVGWLGFSDVDGNQWARSSEGELRRITKPSDIVRLTS